MKKYFSAQTSKHIIIRKSAIFSDGTRLRSVHVVTLNEAWVIRRRFFRVREYSMSFSVLVHFRLPLKCDEKLPIFEVGESLRSDCFFAGVSLFTEAFFVVFRLDSKSAKESRRIFRV